MCEGEEEEREVLLLQPRFGVSAQTADAVKGVLANVSPLFATNSEMASARECNEYVNIVCKQGKKGKMRLRDQKCETCEIIYAPKNSKAVECRVKVSISRSSRQREWTYLLLHTQLHLRS